MEEAVLGLGLCPFAAEPWNAGRVRLSVSCATSQNELLEELRQEIETLSLTDPDTIETTLLIIPGVLLDFSEFNQFLDLTDGLITQHDWTGEFQIASFHPKYQFANTQPDDPSNLTNCSPYPILHILRESSMTRALETYANPERIPITNVETLQNLSEQRRREIFGPAPK